MRFYRNALAVERDVRWFFAAPDAQVLGIPTRFGSGNYAGDRYDWPGVGEVLGADRVWRNGQRNPQYRGQRHCGADALFLNGTLFPPALFPRGLDGFPLCCDAMRLRVGLDGAIGSVSCDTVWGMVPSTHPSITVDISGQVDVPGCSALSAFNGSWVVGTDFSAFPCFYFQTFSSPDFVLSVLFNADASIDFQIDDQTTANIFNWKYGPGPAGFPISGVASLVSDTCGGVLHPADLVFTLH